MKDILNVLAFLSEEKKIQVTVKDFSRLLAHHPQFAGDKSLGVHYNPYCEYIKSNIAAKAHCVVISHIDLYNKIAGSKDIGKPFFGVCYGGVKEYVVPIVANNTVIAAFIAGACPCDAERLESSFDRISKKFDFDKAKLENLYGESFGGSDPIDDGVKSILHICAKYLGDYFSDQAALNKIAITGKHQLILDTAINYIRANLHTKLPINEIAAACYCSESHLSHCFTDIMEISLGKYIFLQRIAKAKKLLAITSLSVSEISETCGFSSPEYFSNAFTKSVGVCAVDYRRNSQLNSKEKI